MALHDGAELLGAGAGCLWHRGLNLAFKRSIEGQSAGRKSRYSTLPATLMSSIQPTRPSRRLMDSRRRTNLPPGRIRKPNRIKRLRYSRHWLLAPPVPGNVLCAFAITCAPRGSAAGRVQPCRSPVPTAPGGGRVQRCRYKPGCIIFNPPALGRRLLAYRGIVIICAHPSSVSLYPRNVKRSLVCIARISTMHLFTVVVSMNDKVFVFLPSSRGVGIYR